MLSCDVLQSLTVWRALDDEWYEPKASVHEKVKALLLFVLIGQIHWV